MKTNYLIVLFTSFIVFNCDTKNETYYKDYLTDEVMEEKAYLSLKDSLSNFVTLQESMVSTKETNDSLIHTYFHLKFPKNMANPWENLTEYIGKELPIDTLTTLTGKQISLKQNNNKPTLLHFWFTKFPPCIKEIPDLNTIYKKHKDNINFISITFDKKDTVETFLKEHNFSFLAAVNAKEILDALKQSAYPANVFIDKNNKVKFVFGNSVDEGALFNHILENM